MLAGQSSLMEVACIDVKILKPTMPTVTSQLAIFAELDCSGYQEEWPFYASDPITAGLTQYFPMVSI